MRDLRPRRASHEIFMLKRAVEQRDGADEVRAGKEPRPLQLISVFDRREGEGGKGEGGANAVLW